jgi:hypothetical protein
MLIYLLDVYTTESQKLPRIMYVADDLILNANLDPTFG